MNDSAFNLVKDSLPRKGWAAPPAVRREPTREEIDELFAERITAETDLPPLQPLFRMFDTPCFYRGELVADCGKAKSGKTFFLSVVMAACLTQKVLALERYTASLENAEDDGTQVTKPLRVVWIDTEQSQQSTQEIIRDRIKPLVEDPSVLAGMDDNFFAFNLRGMGFEMRRRQVNMAIRLLKPDIAIIDGIKDLMTDINDAVQATFLMEELMALAKDTNCCIVCVLHQNKAEQDRNMRGSIGTELTNKAFEVFQCEVIEESETFKVTQTFSRKQKMKRKLYYRVNEQGLPVECRDYQEQPRNEQGQWVSKNTKQTETQYVKPESFNQKYIIRNSEDDTYQWNLRMLFEDAMEGRTSRPYKHMMGAALKLSHIENSSYFYALASEAEDKGIIRKATHPQTQETWVEMLENTLPF